MVSTLTKLTGSQARPHQPHAVYEAANDTLHIQLRDRSVTEVALPNGITLLRDNFPQAGRSDVSGLRIEGLRAMFGKMGNEFTGVWFVRPVEDLIKEDSKLAELPIMQTLRNIDLTFDLSPQA